MSEHIEVALLNVYNEKHHLIKIKFLSKFCFLPVLRGTFHYDIIDLVLDT